MATGNSEQIERWLDCKFSKRGYTKSYKENKVAKHRKERRRAKNDPECQSLYRRYSGYIW